MTLADELKRALEFPHDGVDDRLRELVYDWSDGNANVRGRFYYLAFQDGKPSVEAFVDFIYGRIVYFCLPRKERRRQLELYESSKDLRHLQNMFDKAKRLLISAKSQARTLGEPGELILFILLEAMLKAPQIACKMYLKTSEEMPVHGSDGIHVAYDESDDTLTLYWGESKVYADLPGALDEVCASIASFTTSKDGKIPRRRDIDILKDHIDLEDGPTRQAILDYFDPYSAKHNSLREEYACFVGFDYSFFEKTAGMKRDALQAAFEKKYLARITSACKLFSEKIADAKLDSLNFHLFLIPFPSVAALRSLYLSKLGA